MIDAMQEIEVVVAHEHLAGDGKDVDLDVIRAYWSLRGLLSTRWLAEHGYGAPATFPEVAVLLSLAGRQ